MAISFKRDDLSFNGGRYPFGGGTYLECVTSEGELWATVSINLYGYGFVPPYGQIVIAHDIVESDLYTDIIKPKFVEKEIRDVIYGMATSKLVQLKENWEDLCDEMYE